jgi:hypothetical protein
MFIRHRREDGREKGRGEEREDDALLFVSPPTYRHANGRN